MNAFLPSRAIVPAITAIAVATLVAGCTSDDAASKPRPTSEPAAAKICLRINAANQTPILSAPAPLDLDELEPEQRQGATNELRHVARTAREVLDAAADTADDESSGALGYDIRAVTKAVDDGELRSATFAAVRLSATANEFAKDTRLEACVNRLGILPTVPGPKLERIDGRHVCLDDPRAVGDLAGPPQAGDQETCHEQHRYESYATFDSTVADDRFPGDQVLAQSAVEQCRSALADMVGPGGDTASLSYVSVTPSAHEWHSQHRQFSCFVFDPHRPVVDSSLLTGS